MVHRHADAKVTDTKTSDIASQHYMHPGAHGGDLDDVADNEHDDTNSQAHTTSLLIRGICTTKSANKGTNIHVRNHKGKVLAESVDEVFENLHSRYLTLAKHH